MEHCQFRHPFTCIIAGPTRSGKTEFVKKLIKNKDRLIDKPIGKILWCYGIKTASIPFRLRNTQIQFFNGLPSELEMDKINPDLIIVDDLMTELNNSVQLLNMFTKEAHHKNRSIICLLQNFFHKGGILRSLSLNAHYLILMKNPRDQSQIYPLARQLCPKNPKRFIEVYENATAEPYSYIRIDVTPQTPDYLRYQTRIKKAKVRKAVLDDKCNDCLYNAIHEITFNAVRNKIPLNSNKIRQLRKSKNLILRTSKKVKGKKLRKQLVSQSGGYLHILIPTVAAIIGSLVKDGVFRKS
ncbi:hypothetical protein B4U80_02434 [Leptotrombidium deliense]|uniref:Uncharacterized protein n=1 Tax=Leptotrombidium deliense TaxID=299467 RepID=A0A443SG28_9ACAR|nr:hypothetical protein B4U80_02434 [Leptotrombidium deliense]